MFLWNLFKKKPHTATPIGVEKNNNSKKKPDLHHHLTDNLDEIRKKLGNSSDIIIRQFECGSSRIPAAAVYIDGLTDKEMVDDFVMRSMEFEISSNTDKTIKNMDELLMSILSGDTIILIDGWTAAISGRTRGGQVRQVSEPTAQVVIRGPKESFTESIGTNVSLLRRKIKNANLWVDTLQIGEVTQTDVSIVYIKGIANDKIVQEVKKRLKDIHTDSILESGYIEQFIEDNIYSLFPTVYNTERPDIVAGNLLEGRIAILVDGTPFVLITPVSFFMFFQSVEDYYQRFIVSSMIRLLRYIALLISLFGPSVYIASITFHQEMIPTPLLISLASQREGVPFPAFIEALIMEFTFEILREAGVRMPRAIGQAVSIVGALVLGQAAVQAGIVSPAMVIVVSITGISSFTTPAFSMALSVRAIRFLIMFSAAIMGFYGIAILSIILIAHMCGIRSFGIPYMTPLAPFNLGDQKDTLIRFPMKFLFSRPRLISQNNITRMEKDEQLGGNLNES
jgi:spore germination protein KA